MKRKLVWLLLSCLVAAALLMASCVPGATKAEEAAPAAEEMVGGAGEESVTLGPFRAGETAQTDKLAVTVTAIWLTDSYDYYSASLDKTITRPSGSGTAYLFASIKIKNLDTVRSYDLPPVMVYGTDMRVGVPETIRGGYTGGTPHETGRYLGDDGLPNIGGKLPPGEEIEGKVLFIIPAGQTGHWVEYRLQIDPAIWVRWLLE